MNILLTGASGFIGSSFIKQFQDEPDVTIHGIGRRPMPEREQYTRLDLRQPFDLEFAPDVVIHAAGRAMPWGSSAEFEAQNVTITKNVIEFCLKRHVPHLIYLSSGSVFYREADQCNLTEKSPIGPDFVSRYSQTKYAGETLVGRFPGRWVILRPRAVFGPGDTVLFPRIIRAAQRGVLARITHPGPPAKGDFIYIDTLCEYIMRCVRDPGVFGEFNLTNNEPVEIEAFLFGILRELNLALPKRKIPRWLALEIGIGVEWFYRIFHPQTEPPITRFGVGMLAYSKTYDVTKALNALGSPSVDLATGTRRFLEWQKRNMPSV